MDVVTCKVERVLVWAMDQLISPLLFNPRTMPLILLQFDREELALRRLTNRRTAIRERSTLCNHSKRLGTRPWQIHREEA